MKDLKQTIDKYKNIINIIKEIFNKMINVMDMYYKINNDIIDTVNVLAELIII